MRIVTKWLRAGLSTAAEKNLIFGNLEGIALAVQQDEPFSILDIEGTILFDRNGGFGFFSHRSNLLLQINIRFVGLDSGP
jgi:hypothetical protein